MCNEANSISEQNGTLASTIYYNGTGCDRTTAMPISSASATFDIKSISRILLLFIAVLGCLANATVLYVLARSRKSLGSTVSVFILNQTFLDLLACFLLASGTVVIIMGVSKFSIPMCILVGGGVSTMAAMNASIMSLVVITIERYVKIVHPIHHRNYFRRWMTYVGVALCWIDGLSTCVVSDFVIGRNCLSMPLRAGKVSFVKFFKYIIYQ
jgi:hypothetical protein